MKTSKKPVKAREITFSSFRTGINAKGWHCLEVRSHDQEWLQDGNAFRARGDLIMWLRKVLGMVLHKDGPYLEDAKHPGKPPCWHAGIARELKLPKEALT